jgi:hypothetical protein
MSNLRSKLIRLANKNPALRADLLPLLRVAVKDDIDSDSVLISFLTHGDFDSGDKRVLRDALLTLVAGYKSKLKGRYREVVDKLYLEGDSLLKTAGKHAATFADLLSEQWQTVKYNPSTGEGWAAAGSLGKIKFRESANDPAVWVTIPEWSFKADSWQAMEILEMLRKVHNAS